jgi:hypothetical protein
MLVTHEFGLSFANQAPKANEINPLTSNGAAAVISSHKEEHPGPFSIGLGYKCPLHGNDEFLPFLKTDLPESIVYG